MNPGFARRLIFVQSVALSLAFVMLAFAAAVIAFGLYARALQGQVDESTTDVGAYVAAHGTPRDAAGLAREIAVRFFRPDLDVVVLDATTRAEVRSRTPASSRERLSFVAIDVGPRSAPPRRTPEPAARLALAVASFFGLGSSREDYGPVTVIVRPDDRVFVATIAPFVPGFVVAVGIAIVLGITLGRLLALQALQPLFDVTKALERFAAGDLSPQPIPADRKHQLGALATAYNGAIAQMSKAFAERDRAQAAMQRFIADAGHQLRTPLTVIRGFIAVLRKGELRNPADSERILETMNRQSLLMGTMIDKLMLLDRWQAGAPTAEARPIDVGQLVEDVVAPIAEAAPARTIRIDVDQGASAAIDPSELAQAVTNLVDNALKYTRGAVAVSTRSAGSRIEVGVKDEGPGMSPEELRHAFDRFYRGETRRDVDGSGLGLSIARAAVERAGGTLAVASDSGGSLFTITLPRAPGGARAVSPAPEVPV